ncbi:MAG: 6-pyruvoyltetrahydropterin/6-carboxytetrahydropterin synthase [Fusobacteriaceae bacterium]|jgi:6-pyruvoyltetrahydropterin/6-carboxytetrahydropterin synthase|nr:queD [Fusobacteriales bacterium]MDN5305337.1 6-pyruvoyltetrahydropterin/6-carboxytetrahydropterin synthase [Fusobacteriaceae bacterium]
MYILQTEHSFDSAHFLKGYNGKCANIHGHRWRVVVEIKSNELVEEGHLRGMIVDFGDFKKVVKEFVDFHDHALIVEKNSLSKALFDMLVAENFRIIEVDFRPTAENFSKYFYNEFKKNFDVKRVTVYETPNNSAIYEE